MTRLFGAILGIMMSAKTFGQLVRFLIVGCVNTAVGFSAILVARYGLEMSDFLANLIGYAIGIAVSFPMNRNFTFGDRGAVRPALFRFAISVGVAYLVNLVTLMLFLRVLDAGSLASQVAGMVSYTATFFVLARFFAFPGTSAKISRAEG